MGKLGLRNVTAKPVVSDAPDAPWKENSEYWKAKAEPLDEGLNQATDINLDRIREIDYWKAKAEHVRDAHIAAHAATMDDLIQTQADLSSARAALWMWKAEHAPAIAAERAEKGGE